MKLVIALIAGILFSVCLKPMIKKVPWVFYVLSIIIAAASASNLMFDILPIFARALYPYTHGCLFPFALFVVVMFIGTMQRTSKVRKYLQPIRGELSIIAAILACGHIVAYLISYLGRMLGGSGFSSSLHLVSFITALVLVALLAVLTVTSFNIVKRGMDSGRWTNIQKLAYIFFALIYVHVFFILAESSASFDSKAFVSVVIYSFIFGLYAVLRVRRSVIDNRKQTCVA